MRTYHTPDNPMYNAVEMEWLVGPIPIEQGGKEVVMEYSTAGICSTICLGCNRFESQLRLQRIYLNVHAIIGRKEECIGFTSGTTH